MLTKDMKFIDADIDKETTYMERVHTYEESWNAVLSGHNRNADVTDLEGVLIREGQLGYVPAELYSKPPFSTMSRLMEKNGLTTTVVREFLNWTAKRENVRKARAAQVKKKGKQGKKRTKGNKQKKKQNWGDF